ncbi:hypothetical protein Efla_005406 [Eimeria flavescens]
MALSRRKPSRGAAAFCECSKLTYQLQQLYAVTFDKDAPDASRSLEMAFSSDADNQSHPRYHTAGISDGTFEGRKLSRGARNVLRCSKLTYQQYQLQQLYAVTFYKDAPDVSSTPSCLGDWKTHWEQLVSAVVTASRALAHGVRHQSTDLRSSKSPDCSTTHDALELLVFFTHCPWAKIGRISKQNVMFSSCLCETRCGVERSSACVDSQE